MEYRQLPHGTENEKFGVLGLGFGGIGTTPLRALMAGRRGLMTELNPDYFRDGVGYLEAADNEREMPTLFDFLE